MKSLNQTLKVMNFKYNLYKFTSNCLTHFVPSGAAGVAGSLSLALLSITGHTHSHTLRDNLGTLICLNMYVVGL